MRIARFCLLLTLACLMLCGCQRTGEIENQAYVLILGLDRGPDGGFTLTARVPKVGKDSSGETREQPGSGKYLTFTATGEDWPRVGEALERATPRPLNMSHIEMIVASRTLASEAGFPELMRCVAQTPHLYTTARFVVCDGSAGDFVRAQEAVIGQRLSAELKAMLSHYADEGTIPDSSLADFDYAVHSVYADPTAILARLDGNTDTLRQRYEGAALFRGGVCVMTLDADETRLLRLIRGETRALPIALDGRAVELVQEGRAGRSVTVSADGVTLGVRARLSTLDEVTDGEINAIEDRLRFIIVDLIAQCQRAGVEPFGFSEKAAAGFLTVPLWLSSGWRSRYASARIKVDVRVVRQTSS